MTDRERAVEILATLNPAPLAYQEWLRVGMALKNSGCSASTWASWSSKDARRYHEHECERLWGAFGTSVRFGTLVDIASRYGVKAPMPEKTEGRALDWNDGIVIGKELRSVRREDVPAPEPIFDSAWLEPEDVPAPASDWQDGDMIRYLQAMFQPDEFVGLVCDAWQDAEGRWLPKKGTADRTCAMLIEELRHCGGDIGKVFGDIPEAAGAWVRVNPLDGLGGKDSNVTAFRHTLIEADDMDMGKQLALIHELRLPCTVIVHSGGKSLHALVRVDARDAAEYRARVDQLYGICKANGFKTDEACRNPARLSRLPGVLRAGKPQYLVSGKCGADDWSSWLAWTEEITDDLPDIERLEDVFDDPDDLDPELIAGILRQGHKMRLTGPSKAGKSFGLIQLAIAIAEGKEWLGKKCKQGVVLYLNAELSRKSFLSRIRTVYRVLGWRPDNKSSFRIWHLRGKTVPIDRLVPSLIRRAQKEHFSAIIIDPIYKFNLGDENDAGDASRFVGHLERICTELGCAIIDCHHHSKGSQGQKRSMDRGSGSGVFARDPDAILDMIELSISDKRRVELANSYVESDLTALAGRLGLDVAKWPIEDRRPAEAALAAFQMAFPDHSPAAADVVFEARTRSLRVSGWRVEATLREFPPMDSFRLWFDYPCHRQDSDDLLKDAKADGETPPWQAERERADEARKRKKDEAKAELEQAIESGGGSGVADIDGLVGVLGCSNKTVRGRIKASKRWRVENGVVFSIEGDTPF